MLVPDLWMRHAGNLPAARAQGEVLYNLAYPSSGHGLGGYMVTVVGAGFNTLSSDYRCQFACGATSLLSAAATPYVFCVFATRTLESIFSCMILPGSRAGLIQPADWAAVSDSFTSPRQVICVDSGLQSTAVDVSRVQFYSYRWSGELQPDGQLIICDYRCLERYQSALRAYTWRHVDAGQWGRIQ